MIVNTEKAGHVEIATMGVKVIDVLNGNLSMCPMSIEGLSENLRTSEPHCFRYVGDHSMKCHSVARSITMGFESYRSNGHDHGVSPIVTVHQVTTFRYEKLPINDGSNPSGTIAGQSNSMFPNKPIHLPSELPCMIITRY